MDIIMFFQTMTDTLWGTYSFQVLFYLCLLLILILEKKKERKIEFFCYSFFLLIIIYNPITYFICKFLFGEENLTAYYCRLFCLVPIVFIISYALVLILRFTSGWKKLGCLFVMLFIVILSGHSMYQDDEVTRAENIDKVPEDVLQLSALFQEYDGPITIMASSDLTPYIRQIDPKFSLAYGRQVDGLINEQLQSTTPDIKMILKDAKRKGTDYLMVSYCEESLLQYIEWGCEVVGYTNQYVVLRMVL